MKVSAKVTSKGQLTIPIAIRRELGVSPGDRIIFESDDEGDIRVVRQSKPDSPLRGFLENKVGGVDLPVTVDEMTEAVKRQANRNRFG